MPAKKQSKSAPTAAAAAVATGAAASSAAASTGPAPAAAASAPIVAGKLPANHEMITEGKATIIFSKENRVFYNKVQCFNRDMSILAIRTFIARRKQEIGERIAKKKANAAKAAADAAAKAATAPAASASVTDSKEKAGKTGGKKAPFQPKAGDAAGSDESKRIELKWNGVSILEALSATGLRSLRYWHEINDPLLPPPIHVTSIAPAAAPAAAAAGDQKDVKSSSAAVAAAAVAAPAVTTVTTTAVAASTEWTAASVGVPNIRSILVNDIEPDAVHAIRRNIHYNGVSDQVVIPNLGDAKMVMYQHMSDNKQKFDVVDLDPYGSASMFVDAAVQCVAEGGLLAVTCTDKGVLCGNNSEACFGKYGSMPLRAKFCHELALRIVLTTLETAANKYKRYIVPLVSLSIDFYVRLFVRVYTSPINVKLSASKQASVYQCVGCESFHLNRLGKVFKKDNYQKYTPGTGPPVDRKCATCDSVFKIGGPVWADPIHDQLFVRDMLHELDRDTSRYATHQRMSGMLGSVLDELPNAPLYYTPSALCASVHVTCPKAVVFRSALLNGGYRVSGSHTIADCLKTDAPPEFIYDMLRHYVTEHPIKESNPDSPAMKILAKPPKAKVDFTINKAAMKDANAEFAAKFFPNPEANWGPKARAQPKRKRDGSGGGDDDDGADGGDGDDGDAKAEGGAGADDDDDADGDAGAALTAKSKANQGKNTKKRKKCRALEKTGFCQFGDKCKFKHEGVVPLVAPAAAAAAATTTAAGAAATGGVPAAHVPPSAVAVAAVTAAMSAAGERTVTGKQLKKQRKAEAKANKKQKLGAAGGGGGGGGGGGDGTAAAAKAGNGGASNISFAKPPTAAVTKMEA